MAAVGRHARGDAALGQLVEQRDDALDRLELGRVRRVVEVLELVVPTAGKRPAQLTLHLRLEVLLRAPQEPLHHLVGADLPPQAGQDRRTDAGPDRL
jgi:hypothetical protein